MATALVIVDVQRDFIDGALGGEGRERVVGPLVRLAREADYVVTSQDWHPADHRSFSDRPTYEDGSWPVHCVQGTAGAGLDPTILKLGATRFRKGTDPNVEAYSAFDGTDEFGRTLNADLSMHGIDTVIVGGLCTDYCVKATALDAQRLGYRVVVPLEATAGVSPDTTAAAVAEMEKAGVFTVAAKLST